MSEMRVAIQVEWGRTAVERPMVAAAAWCSSEALEAVRASRSRDGARASRIVPGHGHQARRSHILVRRHHTAAAARCSRMVLGRHHTAVHLHHTHHTRYHTRHSQKAVRSSKVVVLEEAAAEEEARPSSPSSSASKSLAPSGGRAGSAATATAVGPPASTNARIDHLNRASMRFASTSTGAHLLTHGNEARHLLAQGLAEGGAAGAVDLDEHGLVWPSL